MRSIIGLTALLVCLPFAPAYADRLSITCEFSSAAVGSITKDRLVEITIKEQEPMEVTFTDLNSESPSMSFTLGPVRSGSNPLEVIRKEVGIVWLAQSPELGRVNFWTIFLKQNIAILSQHYTNEPLGLQKPVGMISIGLCH